MAEFEWDEWNLGHIAKHSVAPEEAEQVVLNAPVDLNAELRSGEMRVISLGETDGGRILVVVTHLRTTGTDHRVRVVTAWDAKERLRAFWRTQQRGRSRG